MIQEDRNYVSVKSWMGMMFITAIPIVGLLMILVWAFTGENETRKNYFRAVISWILIIMALGLVAVYAISWLGVGPALQKFMLEHQH